MALNDPQWGRRRGDGPPDLDEILSRFNKTLAGLFGRKGSSGPPGGDGGNRPIGGSVGLIDITSVRGLMSSLSATRGVQAGVWANAGVAKAARAAAS